MDRRYKRNLPSPGFRHQVIDEVMSPFYDVISGEVTATVNRPLGIARFPGRIKNVTMSVAGLVGGDTNANIPRVSGEVFINKVSAVTTKCSIGHISGETLQHKTTDSEAADTPVIECVINEAANTFVPGDILTWTCWYSGSASTANVQSPSILVEVEPTT